MIYQGALAVPTRGVGPRREDWDDREENGFDGGPIVFAAEGRVRVDLARYDDGFDLGGKTLRHDWGPAPAVISVGDLDARPDAGNPATRHDRLAVIDTLFARC